MFSGAPSPSHIFASRPPKKWRWSCATRLSRTITEWSLDRRRAIRGGEPEGVGMSRRVKEFFDIPEPSSLDELIGNLVALRDRLPTNARPEMKLCANDISGGALRIGYFREPRSEEVSHRRYEVGSSSSGNRWIVV